MSAMTAPDREAGELYDSALSERPWLVVANKMDDPNAAENLRHFKRRFRKVEIVPISAELGEGIEELKQVLERCLFPAAPEPNAPAE